MTTKNNPEIQALQAVYEALKDLSPEIRNRVLKGVFALLGLENFGPEPSARRTVKEETGHDQNLAKPKSEIAMDREIGLTDRQKSLMELMLEKNPTTNAERITLFAYYRERFEGNARFGRADLEQYFAKAKVAPPGNYARDFNESVRRGWLHEDGSDSYVTSRGIEAVESGFTSKTSVKTSKKKGSAKSRKPSKTKR